MKPILILLWIAVCLAAGVATLILISGMAAASGAPQEAVVCALAVAVAVIPYVFTRAVEGIALASKDETDSIKNKPSPPPRPVQKSAPPKTREEDFLSLNLGNKG